MIINYVNHTDKDTKEEQKLINKIFKQFRHRKDIFSIIFVSNEEIKNINREYRNIDKITDVISFAYNDNDIDNIYADYEIGDIFICLDRAYEQAIEYGHSKEREVGFLAVHGYLHLKGYDHMTLEDEKEMFSLQEKILEKVGLIR